MLIRKVLIELNDNIVRELGRHCEVLDQGRHHIAYVNRKVKSFCTFYLVIRGWDNDIVDLAKYFRLSIHAMKHVPDPNREEIGMRWVICTLAMRGLSEHGLSNLTNRIQELQELLLDYK